MLLPVVSLVAMAGIWAMPSVDAKRMKTKSMRLKTERAQSEANSSIAFLLGEDFSMQAALFERHHDEQMHSQTHVGEGDTFEVPTCFNEVLARMQQDLCSGELKWHVDGLFNDAGEMIFMKFGAGHNGAVYQYSSHASWPACDMSGVAVKTYGRNKDVWRHIVREEARYGGRSFAQVCTDEETFQNMAAGRGIAPPIYRSHSFTCENVLQDAELITKHYCVHFMRRASGPSLKDWVQSGPDADSRSAWSQHFKAQLTELGAAGISHRDLHDGNVMFDCPGGKVSHEPSPPTCTLNFVDFEFARTRKGLRQWFRERSNGVSDTKSLIKHGVVGQ